MNRTNATTKLALGTVQFGLPYGVANTGGQVSSLEAAAILRMAARAGLNTLDTAIAYGDSERCLGSIGMSAWRVITKLPPVPEGSVDIRAWVDGQLQASRERLGVTRLEAVLLHRPADAVGVHGNTLILALEEMKDAGHVGAAGISIYEPGDLEQVWPMWQPDLVQAPYNVLDRRLARSGWLERLAAAGTRVHVRSAFLQGLLLMPAASWPQYFSPFFHVLHGWIHWCREQQISALEGALSFALAPAEIERVVVGVDSSQHLEQILAAARRVCPMPPENIGSDLTGLIEPRFWRLK